MFVRCKRRWYCIEIFFSPHSQYLIVTIKRFIYFSLMLRRSSTLRYKQISLISDDSTIGETADLVVDFGEVVAIEIEKLQLD